MVRYSKMMLHPTIEGSIPAIASRSDAPVPVRLTLEQLRKYTDDFSQENFLGDTMFSKLYRGKISTDSGLTKQVIVKILPGDPYYYIQGDFFSKLSREVFFLRHPSVRTHPNLVKLYGYFCPRNRMIDTEIGVVYDINPLDTLSNLIRRDDFSWLQRIKVALGLARMLEFFHSSDSPYMVRNLDPAHILIDQDYNPLLSDFGSLIGGIFGYAREPYERMQGAYGFRDPYMPYDGSETVTTDVYVFGSILLSLISKRVTDKPHKPREIDISFWARGKYKKNLFSLFTHRSNYPSRYRPFHETSNLLEKVIPYLTCRSNASLAHKSFKEDPNFHGKDARKITKLATRCIRMPEPMQQPNMMQVVKKLSKIHDSLSILGC